MLEFGKARKMKVTKRGNMLNIDKRIARWKDK